LRRPPHRSHWVAVIKVETWLLRMVSSSPLKIRGVESRQFWELNILRILLKNQRFMIPDICNELSTSHFYHTRRKIDQCNRVKSGNWLENILCIFRDDVGDKLVTRIKSGQNVGWVVGPRKFWGRVRPSYEFSFFGFWSRSGEKIFFGWRNFWSKKLGRVCQKFKSTLSFGVS
jgi:hypothetical protein